MENTNKEDFKVDEQNKIYIIGGRGVGKTTFLYRILNGQFKNDIPQSQIGIMKSQYKIGSKEFTIKDLTDDENFTSTNVLKNELEDVLLIFVLFSLDDKNTFEYAKTLIEFIKHNLINNKEMNIILLGNKYDILENSPQELEKLKKEVDKYIYNIENLFFYEISCQSGYNMPKIMEIFDSIEIEEEKDDEEDDKIPEEERKKKVIEAKEKSCIIN